MNNVHIKRIKKHSTKGTVGILFINSKEICYTLELPDKNNKINVSCIPGNLSYDCSIVDSPTFGNVYEVCNVPDRTHILFHIANFLDDIKGCIALGDRYDEYEGKYVVWDSKVAFNRFMKYLNNKPFKLTITENLI